MTQDPYEVNNLVGSSQPEHQAALRELRAALLRWQDETDDQGKTAEDPRVLEYWDEIAQQAQGRFLPK